MRLKRCVIVGTLALALFPVSSFGGGEPKLPRLHVDTQYAPPEGRTIAVRAGDDFQKALNLVQPGEVITLEAGATFVGPFTLPKKDGSGWIVVRTSAPDHRLPPPGTRAGPSEAGGMPKLEAAGGPVITAAPGAHHYRFIGVEIRPRRGVFLHNLVALGSNETSKNDLPHHLIFDRSYLHGDPKKGTRRGIAMNSRYTAVIDSYLSDFKEVGADSQAIAGWNGAGPFKIVNNYLEAAGENVMFGGADPTIPGLVPSDIEVRGNHFTKPLIWKVDDPNFAGVPWTVKNLFELKNARRVLIEGNFFEHNWVHAQNGFAILFTVRNQDGGAPWSSVKHVVFQHNIVRHTASALNIHGQDTIHPSRMTKHIAIRNNLFEDVGNAEWGGVGRLFQVLDGLADITIEQNTAFHTGPIIVAEGRPNTRFVFRKNIAFHNQSGIGGTGTFGDPLLTLKTYFRNAVVAENVIVGGEPFPYPPDNLFPDSLEALGFSRLDGPRYCLNDSSPLRGGLVAGIDVDALSLAIGSHVGFLCSCST